MGEALKHLKNMNAFYFANLESKAGSVSIRLLVTLCFVILPAKTNCGQDLTIDATFASNITAAQRTVIQQAISEWDAIILSKGINPSNFPISFINGPLDGSIGTAITRSNSDGEIESSTIIFDNDGTTAWYIDPTPTSFSDVIPDTLFDYLHTARHEIGHALGFFPSASTTPLITGNTFDSGRLNISLAADFAHTNAEIHLGDIMSSAVETGQRSAISLYPAASLLARAYGYDINMSFVDSNTNSVGFGTASWPWKTISAGFLFTPAGRSLLVIPGTYEITVPFDINRNITVVVARGGSVRIQNP